MAFLTPQDVSFIKNNFDNWEDILKMSTRDILLAIDELICDKGFDDYAYNDFGRSTQKVYDRIYLNNHK